MVATDLGAGELALFEVSMGRPVMKIRLELEGENRRARINQSS